MALKLMYITNKPEVAQVAQDAGVDRIFIDMEYIGKADRQGGMDTVQSHHTIDDIRRIRPIITSSELLVRVNPIHEEGSYRGLAHTSSREEVDAVIKAGADIVMLPYFKTLEEARFFIKTVDGRAKTMLLVETVEAAEKIDDFMEIKGIDEIHIGLNDLSLEQHKAFMFQSLADGTVEKLCRKMADKGMTYGFGGIAAPGRGMLPAEYIIRDHYQYGSSCVILSRSFCNSDIIKDMDEIKDIFRQGIKEIRQVEEECAHYKKEDFIANHKELKRRVKLVTEMITAGEV